MELVRKHAFVTIESTGVEIAFENNAAGATCVKPVKRHSRYHSPSHVVHWGRRLAKRREVEEGSRKVILRVRCCRIIKGRFGGTFDLRHVSISQLENKWEIIIICVDEQCITILRLQQELKLTRAAFYGPRLCVFGYVPHVGFHKLKSYQLCSIQDEHPSNLVCMRQPAG